MADVKNGRFAAKIDGDFVVFLIGMRINQLWAVQSGCRCRGRCRGCWRS